MLLVQRGATSQVDPTAHPTSPMNPGLEAISALAQKYGTLAEPPIAIVPPAVGKHCETALPAV